MVGPVSLTQHFQFKMDCLIAVVFDSMLVEIVLLSSLYRSGLDLIGFSLLVVLKKTHTHTQICVSDY